MITIRSFIFETNSSSTHSCILDETYIINKFMKNEYFLIEHLRYLNKDIQDFIKSSLKIIHNKFISDSDAYKLAKFIDENSSAEKYSGEIALNNNVSNFLQQYDIFDYDAFKNHCEYLNIDFDVTEETLSTGVSVSALCYYGYNG